MIPTRAFVLSLLLAWLATASCAATPGENSANPNVLMARSYIAAPYADVWNALTEADRYASWSSSPCLEFGGSAGEPCTWGTTERVVYRGSVLTIEPGAGVTHTFQFVGFGFEEPPTPVRIDVVERGETVLVAIHHDCTGAPRTYDMITPVGWQKSLSRLKTLLETGRAMPWPEEPEVDRS